MPDLTDLEALIARLATIDFSQTSEQATREMAVNPVIDALGWDTFNPAEVAREYSVHGGKVDYCLRGPIGALVLIEVKRTGKELSDHQEQLLDYAFREGAPLAALTDGLIWWLYLPTAEGSWEQRRFYSIDSREQSAAQAASALQRFLSRVGLIGGTALNEAKREFNSQERARRLRVALQHAWKRVLNEPQGLLRDLLAETVEEISGYHPDTEMVSEFLKGVSGSTLTEPGPSPPVPPLDPDARPPSGRRPRAFWLHENRCEATRWSEVLRGVCDQLAKEAGAAFDDRVLPLRASTGRLYFSEEPSQLRRPMQLKHSKLYVSGIYRADRCERLARRVLVAVRGSDDGFRVELAAPN